MCVYRRDVVRRSGHMVPDVDAGRREELLLRTLRRRRFVRAERVQLRRGRWLRETKAGAGGPPGFDRRRFPALSQLQSVRFVVVGRPWRNRRGPAVDVLPVVRRGMVVTGPTMGRASGHVDDDNSDDDYDDDDDDDENVAWLSRDSNARRNGDASTKGEHKFVKEFWKKKKLSKRKTKPPPDRRRVCPCGGGNARDDGANNPREIDTSLVLSLTLFLSFLPNLFHPLIISFFPLTTTTTPLLPQRSTRSSSIFLPSLSPPNTHPLALYTRFLSVYFPPFSPFGPGPIKMHDECRVIVIILRLQITSDLFVYGGNIVLSL